VASPAQDPASWQNSASGLSVQQNSARQTAGLTWTVQANNWPFLFTQGGVKTGNSGNLVSLASGIPLGSVTLPGVNSSALSSEALDWAHNELTYNAGTAGQLKVTASRQSPGLLVQTQARAVQLFTGNVDRYQVSGGNVTAQGAGPRLPKYMAYDSSGVKTFSLSQSSAALPALSGSWLLLWYGSNSAIAETKKPLNRTDYGSGTDSEQPALPPSYAYQADVPVLLVFEHAPATIRQLSQGGVELSFSTGAGSFTATPLYGRDHPRTSETEGWAGGLPGAVAQKAGWWAGRLCQYPAQVSESYSYSPNTTTITESFTFQTVCAASTRFAPLPPMLGIARDLLDITFSGTVIDSGLYTEFGPIQGIENVSSYSWNIQGLEPYVDASRRMKEDNPAPAELTSELNGLVNTMISGGHYRPWVFVDSIPQHNTRGDVYWANPADALTLMIEIAEGLPSNARGGLINTIRAEKTAYPPDTVYNLSLTSGKSRGGFTYTATSITDRYVRYRPEVFLTKVPLYNAYSLARYYDLTGDSLPAQTWTNIQAAFNRSMSEQDWASMYWFQGFEDRRVAVWNANRQFAGLTGYVRLAGMSGDANASALGRGLLAKAAVLRLGMAHYPRYLETAHLVELPAEPNWQVLITRSDWYGHLFNNHWTNASEDARQVVMMNQFGVWLQDQSGFDGWESGMTSPHLVAFEDMTPGLGKLLSEKALDDASVAIEKAITLFPNWYVAFAEGSLGMEHSLSHPIDAYQLFMAKAQIESDTAEHLERYIDIPYLQEADLFYMNKLAETIKQYQGFEWTTSTPLYLYIRPGNKQLMLKWSASASGLPSGTTWKITYATGGSTPSVSPNLATNTRSYTLTGLQNYKMYQVTLSAEQSGQTILSITKNALPTDRFIYLPGIRK